MSNLFAPEYYAYGALREVFTGNFTTRRAMTDVSLRYKNLLGWALYWQSVKNDGMLKQVSKEMIKLERLMHKLDTWQ
jgi:hypothetical protein